MAPIKKRFVDKFSKDLIEQLEKKLTSPNARRRLSNKIRPAMETEIAISIGGTNFNGDTKIAKLLRPDLTGGDELIGKLGIGLPGRGPLTNKIENGWRVLLPGEQETATSISVSFAKSLTSFGTGSVRVDTDAFYAAKVNNYISLSGGRTRGNEEIPWMRHYIEGLQVQGYEFEGDDFIKKSSRTGLGIMLKVPSGGFSLPPLSPNPFIELRSAIVRRLRTNKFTNKIEKEIRKGLRGL